MKNFRPKAWMLPQPVLILGTYDADGTPNVVIGKRVGNAFHDGRTLK